MKMQHALILAAIVLLVVVVLALYARRQADTGPSRADAPAAGQPSDASTGTEVASIPRETPPTDAMSVPHDAPSTAKRTLRDGAIHWPERNVVFPDDAGIVNVREAPYNAKGDGVTDDTAAIQKALTNNISGNKIIYLPAGTYLISDTLKWGMTSPGNAWKRTILQGERTDKTILRLKDNCPGFEKGGLVHGKYKQPDGKAMVWTGKRPAQRFRNAIRDLTLDAGTGNPGAIGARFVANNQGCVRNVLFRSGDGQGRVGLDLGYTDEQGPCLIKNVRIEGFDIGLYSWGSVDSLTLYNIELAGQHELGILNDHQVMNIENLYSRNAVPALRNLHGDGVITLIGADLRTPGDAVDTAAIDNRGALYARDIQTEGYAMAIRNSKGTKANAEGPAVAEFVSHKPLNLSGDEVTALHLPIKPTPEVPWDSLDNWVSPLEFGGKPNDEEDDTEAIQKAIDSGKTTVYLPNGKWMLKGDLFVRGKVRRIIGCEATWIGNGVIRIVDGDAPVVKLERFSVHYHQNIVVKHESKRTLVLSSCRFLRNGCYEGTGGGDLFVEDVCGDPWSLNNQNAWMRQVNPESSHHVKMETQNSTLWILGLKTEGDHTNLVAKQSAVEICGAFIYSNTRSEKKPNFIIEDSDFSATMGESSFRGFPYKQLVVETRDGKTTTLGREGVPARGEGRMLPLYSNREAEAGTSR